LAKHPFCKREIMDCSPHTDCSLVPMEDYRSRVPEKRILRRIFGSEREE
jgi:hypothetical protein